MLNEGEKIVIGLVGALFVLLAWVAEIVVVYNVLVILEVANWMWLLWFAQIVMIVVGGVLSWWVK